MPSLFFLFPRAIDLPEFFKNFSFLIVSCNSLYSCINNLRELKFYKSNVNLILFSTDNILFPPMFDSCVKPGSLSIMSYIYMRSEKKAKLISRCNTININRPSSQVFLLDVLQACL